MSELSLLLLGPPRVERDGQPIQVDTRKAIALLAYLAINDQPQTRERLAALLYPEYNESRARAALRRTLSALKVGLGDPWLYTSRNEIQLRRSPGYWCDVDQFHHHLETCHSHGHGAHDVCADCLPSLTEAVQLYQDDFLAGFTLRDSASFDEWQSLQVEGLHRQLTGALERLVRGLTAQGQIEPAIQHARRLLSTEPMHEPAHRVLMLLYAWSGERPAALRQYRECVRILDMELGVQPLVETTQLYQAILEQREPKAPQRMDARPASPIGDRPEAMAPALPSLSDQAQELRPDAGRALSSLPLVGRSIEWSDLQRAYDRVKHGGHFVLLEGEAGIGKTRLAEEFLASVRVQGGTTIHARCYEGEEDLAYSPFIESVRWALAWPEHVARLDGVPPHWLSEAIRLLPELGGLRPHIPPPPPLDSPVAQSRFFEGFSQLLRTLAGSAPPGALLLDDLQWADTASLDLLAYMVRRLDRLPMLVVGTWRHGHDLAGDRVQALLAATQRSGRATHLPLNRLSQADVDALLTSLANSGYALPEGAGPALFQESEGLPFFLAENMTALVQMQNLPDGVSWPLAGSVRNLLRSRLAPVSETGWQLLTTAAVLGRSFDFETLRAASGRGEEEIIAALEQLVARGLLREMDGGSAIPTYDFNHHLLRRFVDEETSLARRRLLHRRAAQALAARLRSSQDSGLVAGQIAHHYQMAGDDGLAAQYHRQAGEQARDLFANAEALTHFQAALALGHPDVAALHEAIGDLQILSGEYDGALSRYERAAALAPERTGILERKLGQVHHRRGQWDLAESHYRAAVAGLDQSNQPAEHARVVADWSLTVHQRGEPARAMELAREALALATQAGDDRALAQAHNILGVLARHQGQPDLACQHLEQSLALAQGLGDPAARAAALNNLALAYRDRGQLQRAIELTEMALELCATQGDRHREAALHNNLADLLHAAGQAEAAMAQLKEAVRLFVEIGEEGNRWQPEIWKLVEW